MKLQRWIGLPWKIKNTILSMRCDLSEIREILSEVTHSLTASRQISSDTRQLVTDQHRALAEMVGHRHETLSHEIASLGERLLGEIREQGLLSEIAARSPSRAEAERKLRARLTTPLERHAGLSILITCWNHAGFLRRAVASALSTLDVLSVPGEVLILDDASRDGSRDVARELARVDPRIHSIESDDNLGLPRARNVLLSQARFHYSMILDSDNELVPSGIAVLYDMARQSNAVLTYGNILKLDEQGSVLGVMSNERVTPNLLYENWIDAMALVHTERLLELGGYDCHWLYGYEDWELNYRLFLLGQQMVFVPVLTGKYWTQTLSMLSEAPAPSRYRRGQRIFTSANAIASERYKASVQHPATGLIWSSSERKAGSTAISKNAPSSRPGLKVLVVSSAGVRNHGDDAILLSTLERLRRVRPESVASVVTDGPDIPPLGRLGAWRGTCDELISSLDPRDILTGCGSAAAVAQELIARFSPGSGPRTDLKAFDTIVMAGGGNLNSYWPNIIARRAAIAAAANAVGVPYVISGQGVGPVSTEIIPMLSYLINGASDVATRDRHSLAMLQEISPNNPRMSMIGDDALGLKCDDPSIARSRLTKIGVPVDRPLLGFHAREADYVGIARDQLHETARHVDEFAAENGYVVMAVPINTQFHGLEAQLLSDLAYNRRRHAPWHVVNHAGDVAAIAGTIKSCSAVLTHSYHLAIFALESRIPTLLYAATEYYRLKAEGLRTGFGIPVPLLAKPEIKKHEIADALKRIAHSTWTPGMTSAAIDRWLDTALPEPAQAVAQPSSSQRPQYKIHDGTPSPPAPKSLTNLKSLDLIAKRTANLTKRAEES